MNRNLTAALVVATAAFAGQAFAETPTPDVPFTSTKARAEVQAELAAFRASGVNPWSIQYNPLRHVQSTKTRTEVVAEYLANRDQADALGYEDSGAAYYRQATGRVTVRDTLALAR